MRMPLYFVLDPPQWHTLCTIPCTESHVYCGVLPLTAVEYYQVWVGVHVHQTVSDVVYFMIPPLPHCR